MLKRLKNFFSKQKNWNDILLEIIEEEKNKIVFPVLMFEENMDREFCVFKDSKGIIEESIFGHWSGVTPICPKLDAFIVDSTGKKFVIENELYDKENKICYSYPRKQIGCVSFFELRAKIVKGCKEYIEIFEGDDEEHKFKKAILSLNKSESIHSLITIAKEMGF